ncbi:cobalt ECF transporter T component CbiQ [Catenuloplanes atrovinosus]|uniref:Cobalt/nickel transport system permease protein n=1 Tax=Catenuloplanes atrovinosus TaxID=137266 RepID=A0AAE3YUM5_9ACTN|nr:cobalt ECF transporter T component CbiQ [Catenuloplanes atrovinosus]MDR7278971.1 cobalt/nickel transport system permease protein [Catenuloplanes atrovinosus]
MNLDHDSPVHRLAPEVKIAATVAVTIAIVATPREAFWAFGVYALIVAVLAGIARIPAGWLARRSLVEVPFVLLAVLLPFAGAGERIEWWGLHLSVDGLYGGFNLLVKGTLGVLVALILAGTTSTRDIIAGLDRLRCPAVLTQIATFMLRYLDVLIDEARRMRIARLARGDDPRFLWQLRGFATGVGALFLRAFERGERVYLAMLSRGYTGALPHRPDAGAGVAQWATVATVPLVTAAIAVTATIVT